jgi:ankyrin repeat protein
MTFISEYIGDTQLIDAAREGRVADVVMLLAYGEDVNELMTNGYGVTALLEACFRGHTKVVAKLLAANADVNQAKNDGITPLIIACCEGHTEVVTKLLAANANVDQVQNDGSTALLFASRQGHAEIVKKLLAANANITLADKLGDTPLYAACEEGHAEVAALLLAANADVNQGDNEGRTPLWIASQHGHPKVAEMLLAANAEVNANPISDAEDDGVPPLKVAIVNGHLGCVQVLSSYGASRVFVFGPDDTAERCATEYGHHHILAYLIRSSDWSTPLHHLKILTPERAFVLLRGGADVDASAEPSGQTPLWIAQDLYAAGSAAVGTAAFLVLEAAKPWSRKTHQLFPAPARARVVELMLFGELLSREERFAAYGPQAVVDVWMTFVVPKAVNRSYKPRVNYEETLLGKMPDLSRRLAALGFSAVGDA